MSPAFAVRASRREGDDEAGALPGAGTLRSDAAAVGLGQRASDRETDPAPTDAARAAVVDAVEAFEDAREVLGSDSVSGVADGDRDPLRSRSCGQLDLSLIHIS